MKTTTTFAFFATLSALAICFASIFTSSAQAVPVTFQYAGTVDFSDGFPDSAPFDAFDGSTISLEFTFDSDLIDNNPSSNGDYAPVTSSEVVFGGNTYTSTNSGAITIINNGVNPDQFLLFNVPVSGPAIGGYTEVVLNLILSDDTRSVFSTDALPLAQPNPSDFTGSLLRLDFRDPNDFDNFGTVGTNGVVSIPETMTIVEVIYDSPVIDFGPLSLGLTSLPAAPELTVDLGSGTPSIGGATSYGLEDVISAEMIFGDGVSTTLTTFSMEVDAGGTTTALSYSFSPINTSTSTGLVVINFPLTIIGTDIASGDDFSYTYANSEVTITPVPEPTTFALCAVLGFVGVVSRRRRRR